MKNEAPAGFRQGYLHALRRGRNPSEAPLGGAKGDKWLFLWLAYVAASYLIPWWNRVYFLWDDIELLMQLRSPTLAVFFSSHQYQFFPIFKFFYWIEIQLFGVDPKAFLLTSTVIHLINICLVYLIIKKLTRCHRIAFLASVLVSFNKSYFTVIFWPTMQTYLLLTMFTLLSVLFFFKLQLHHRLSYLLLYFASIIAAGFSVGFGILNGFLFALASRIYWPHQEKNPSVIYLGILAGFITSSGIFIFSKTEISRSQLLQLSAERMFNAIYFITAGITQAIISRFFLPGFIPNIYNPANIVVMMLLPLSIIIIFLIGFRQILSLKKNLRLTSLQPLFLFTSFVIIPYFIASLARSTNGALGSLAERYIYFPFFSFILASSIIYFHVHRKLPQRLISFLIPTGFVVILSVGHQIALFFAASQLFVPH